jgi:hypothetical protein
MAVQQRTWLVAKSDLADAIAQRAERDITVQGIDELTARLLSNRPGATAVARDFRLRADPWLIRSTTGETLWTIESLAVTFIRSFDPPSKLSTCFATLAMSQSANGWLLESGGSLRLLTRTGSGGILDDWSLGPLDTDCRSNQTLKTYRKDFRADWLDLAMEIQLIVEGGTWRRCYL